MSKLLAGLLVTGMLAGCAAQPAVGAPPATAPSASQPSSVDDTLDALEARGDTLKDFTADLKVNESDAATGNETTRTGRIWFQKLEGGDAQIHLLLDHKEVEGKKTDEKIEYVYQKGWLEDRNYRQSLSIHRQIVKPGEKIDLLKLGQGPFPLPIGQKKEDVHAMFDVKKIAPGKEDPAGSIHLKLIPQKGSRYARKFDSIDFWVDATTLMPVRVQTAIGDQVATRDLSDIKVNPGLNDSDFSPPAVDEKKWQIRDEPYQE